MSDWMENIAWENTIEFWHLAVLILLLFLGLFWEIKKQKSRQIWRIITLFISFISLYIIYLSPYLLIAKPQKSILLIGQNISDDTVDSLTNQYDLPVLKQQANLKFREGENTSIASLAKLDYQIDTAFVYGYFPQLNPINFQFRKDIEIEKGINIDYPKLIALGDSLSINIENREGKEVNISSIIGNDSISKTISAYGQGRISILPESEGYILAKVSTASEMYQLAVKVEATEHFVIQILSAVPDFEWKFIGDYLKNKEHSVYQKTQISKGIFKSSFFNWHDSLRFHRGVAKDLKVLFADAKAWQDLSPNSKDQYLTKLKENSGSLIIRTNANSQIQLDLDKPKPTNIFSTSDNLLEQNNYNYLEFNNIYGLDEVAENSVFRKVTPNTIYGIINFQNSYQLKLSGKNQEYDEIWSTVFKDLIRKSTELFYTKSKWSVQYQPFFFRLWTDEKVKEILIFNLKNDTIKLKSKPDFIYPERQYFMFYPKTSGWHFIKLRNQSEAIPFYVHAESLANQAEFLYNYNLDYLNYCNFVDSITHEEVEKYNQKPVTIWFFVLFLLCMGYLWIEDKIT